MFQQKRVKYKIIYGKVWAGPMIKSKEKQTAIMLIILFGIISLFGDIIYEGARSVYGPFAKIIGMDIVLLGFITGMAEFLGYFIRFISGYLSDKTKAYWIFTIAGYGMIISIPLLSMASVWQTVAILIICERLGKAVRSPAKDTILSSIVGPVGTGWGFALHEAMDQTGAIIGPLIFTGIFLAGTGAVKTISDYQMGFRLLWIPFIIVMIAVLLAFLKAPDPGKFEAKFDLQNPPGKLSKIFWLYAIFTFVTTLGFVSFVILGYHFKDKGIISDAQIPVFYSIAMGLDAVAALIIGRIYDRLKEKYNNERAGTKILFIIPLFTLFIPFFGFMKNILFITIAVVLWGIVMGTHETIMKSTIADLTHFKKRGLGYGIFNMVYGLAVFFGSLLMGLLYKIHITLIIILVINVEIAALVIYFVLLKEAKEREAN
ncbi:MAG: MFS transporter [bacterium]